MAESKKLSVSDIKANKDHILKLKAEREKTLRRAIVVKTDELVFEQNDITSVKDEDFEDEEEEVYRTYLKLGLIEPPKKTAAEEIEDEIDRYEKEKINSKAVVDGIFKALIGINYNRIPYVYYKGFRDSIEKKRVIAEKGTQVDSKVEKVYSDDRFRITKPIEPTSSKREEYAQYTFDRRLEVIRERMNQNITVDDPTKTLLIKRQRIKYVPAMGRQAISRTLMSHENTLVDPRIKAQVAERELIIKYNPDDRGTNEIGADKNLPSTEDMVVDKYIPVTRTKIKVKSMKPKINDGREITVLPFFKDIKTDIDKYLPLEEYEDDTIKPIPVSTEVMNTKVEIKSKVKVDSYIEPSKEIQIEEVKPIANSTDVLKSREVINHMAEVDTYVKPSKDTYTEGYTPIAQSTNLDHAKDKVKNKAIVDSYIEPEMEMKFEDEILYRPPTNRRSIDIEYIEIPDVKGVDEVVAEIDAEEEKKIRRMKDDYKSRVNSRQMHIEEMKQHNIIDEKDPIQVALSKSKGKHTAGTSKASATGGKESDSDGEPPNPQNDTDEKSTSTKEVPIDGDKETEETQNESTPELEETELEEIELPDEILEETLITDDINKILTYEEEPLDVGSILNMFNNDDVEEEKEKKSGEEMENKDHYDEVIDTIDLGDTFDFDDTEIDLDSISEEDLAAELTKESNDDALEASITLDIGEMEFEWDDKDMEEAISSTMNLKAKEEDTINLDELSAELKAANKIKDSIIEEPIMDDRIMNLGNEDEDIEEATVADLIYNEEEEKEDFFNIDAELEKEKSKIKLDNIRGSAKDKVSTIMQQIEEETDKELDLPKLPSIDEDFEQNIEGMLEKLMKRRAKDEKKEEKPKLKEEKVEEKEEPIPEPTPEPKVEEKEEPIPEPTPEVKEEVEEVKLEPKVEEKTEEPTPEPQEEPTPEPKEEPTPEPKEVEEVKEDAETQGFKNLTIEELTELVAKDLNREDTKKVEESIKKVGYNLDRILNTEKLDVKVPEDKKELMEKLNKRMERDGIFLQRDNDKDYLDEGITLEFEQQDTAEIPYEISLDDIDLDLEGLEDLTLEDTSDGTDLVKDDLEKLFGPAKVSSITKTKESILEEFQEIDEATKSISPDVIDFIRIRQSLDKMLKSDWDIKLGLEFDFIPSQKTIDKLDKLGLAVEETSPETSIVFYKELDPIYIERRPDYFNFLLEFKSAVRMLSKTAMKQKVRLVDEKKIPVVTEEEIKTMIEVFTNLKLSYDKENLVIDLNLS